MQEPRTISGKALIEKLGINEYEIWQEMKQGLRPHGGSFNTQVEVARLLVAEDIPDDLSIIQKLQFSTEDVQIFIKAKGPPKKNMQLLDYLVGLTIHQERRIGLTGKIVIHGKLLKPFA